MSYHSTNETQDEMQQALPALIQNATLTAKSVRAPNNQEWESMKKHICQIYIIEDCTLAEVMKAMKENHNFIASIRQWKTKIRNWGFVKNLSSSDIASIVTKQEKRIAEGKQTVFFYSDRMIPLKIERIRTKTRIDDVYPTVDTPPGILYHTPPRLESPEPLLLSEMLEEQKITYPTGLVAFGPTPRPQEILTDGYVPGLLLDEANGNKQVTHTYKENAQVTEASAQDTHARKVAGYRGGSPSCFYSLTKKREFVEGDVPFTESGYKSAPNLDHSPNSKPIIEKSPSSFIVDSSATEGSRCDDDAKTTYSIGTMVDPDYARKYIIELCDDIYSKLRKSVDTANRSALTTTLPEIVKAFAIKLCHDSPSQTSQMSREMMYFIHKRHKEVATQLEAMFNFEDEDEPDRDRGHLEGMSVLDKMNMWMSKAGQENSVHPNTELFEGVQNDVEDPINQTILSTCHENILDSPAYEWLLENVAKESILELETPQPRIHQQILDKLPTGTISKRRTPKVYEIIFELEWQHDMELSLQYELLDESQRQIRPFRPSIVMTGSPWNAQGLSMKQYLTQTWPTTGLQLLDAREQATINRAKHACVSLPGNTHLESRILPSQLIVTATGPAYFVADCGESLAWVGSALLSKIRNTGRYCLPLITSFQNDSSPSSSSLMKHKGNCKFNFELMHIATSDESLPGVQNFNRDLIGENTIILGFPIRRRPEGYLGLELPFNTLLHYLQAPKAEIFVQDVFIKGPNRVLKLIKHTDDVFLWRLDHSLADYSLCYPDKHSRAIAYEDYSSHHHTLEASRHILSKCADDTAPTENPHRISEGRGLVDTKMTQPRSVTETDSADGLGFPSHNPNNPQNMGGLPAAFEFQNNESALTSPSVGSAYSGFENDARTLRLENSERAELLSQVSNVFFADSQPSSITESCEDSLDSDMFSISDSSHDIELLDRQEIMYPMLHNILHQLLARFRTATKYQSAPVEGRGNSSPVASTTESAHIGNTSRPSWKRKAYQDEEDGTGEDGSQPPRPKKMKPDQGKEAQEPFACPFLKWNPITYSECCVKKLSSISFVKQHLHRKHTPERYCQTCHAANFPDADKLQSHIKIGKCTCRDRTMLDGISYEQRFKLSRKSKPNSSKEEQWYAIWQILFPENQRPNSIYIDTDLALEMRQFREYCESHGPAIMREYIETDPAWQSSDITEEQRRVLDRLMAQGINTLFDNWHSRNSSVSTTSERQRNDSPQVSRNETSTGSVVDSGVAMMGQSPSRGTNSQACELPPAFRIPPVGFASPQTAADSGPRGPLPVQEVPVAPNSTDVPPFASLPFHFVAGGQEWSCADQIDGFEAPSLATFESDFDSGVFPSLEDMLVYYTQPGQDFQAG